MKTYQNMNTEILLANGKILTMDSDCPLQEKMEMSTHIKNLQSKTTFLRNPNTI